jgi:Na+-driven multidrug efflux pump
MAEAKFTHGNLMQHVAVMSFTTSMGLLTLFAVDFVDMIFISMLGNDALAAAVGYAGTLLFFTNAINIGLSIAAGTLVARSLGADDDRSAREHATSVAIAAVLIGIITPIITLLYLEELVGLLGATGDAKMLAVAFIAVIWRYNAYARPSLGLIKRDAKAVLALAGPAVLTNVATPVGSAIMTREIAKYGTEAVAGMAVIGRLTPVAFSVMFALSGAIGPIIGQNAGAGLIDRVRGAFSAGLKFMGIYVLVVSALLFVLRAPIAGMFNAQGETLTLIYLFCGPLALMGYFNGVVFTSNAVFNNLGHPIYSTWINWGRHSIGTWVPIMIFSSFWGAAGVLIGQAVGGVLFALVAYVLVQRVIAESGPSVDSSCKFTPQQRIHMLFARGRW